MFSLKTKVETAKLIKYPDKLEKITLECGSYSSDGIKSLHELLKSLGKNSYILADPEGEIRKAFFLKGKVSCGWEEGNLVVTSDNARDLAQVLMLFIFIRNSGNTGHSFVIKSGEREAGWDGDGADMVKGIYVNDKKLPQKAYNLDDFDVYKLIGSY